MVKRRTDQVHAKTTDGNALSFADVPARLRPSAWQTWLDELGPFIPDATSDDEAFVLAYELTREQAAAVSVLPQPGAHWQAIASADRHMQAYMNWLRVRGLTTVPDDHPESRGISIGFAVRGWGWSDFEDWEKGADD